MASREFIKSQLLKLEQNYGRERFKVTQPLFELWNEMLGKLEEDGLRVSVEEYIKTNEYPPSVASIAKIYKAKLEYREDLRSYLKNKYIWASKWFEEEPTHEIFAEFCKYIMRFPKDKRKAVADEVTRKAIAYYNDKHNKLTFKEYLEGLL